MKCNGNSAASVVAVGRISNQKAIASLASMVCEMIGRGRVRAMQEGVGE